jgi:hypothetical protein
MITIETVEDLQNDWRDQYAQWWHAGMPSYRSKNTEPWKQIRIKFRTMEDRKHFGEKMGYNLTEKTNSVWYPVKEPEKNSLNRYIGD